MRSKRRSPERRGMRRPLIAACLGIALTLASLMTHAQETAPADDPYQWLEDVGGDKSLAWVRERNAESQAALQAQPGYAETRRALLEVLNARDRIPSISRRGDYVYNLWQDEAHQRGLWRRTTLAEYAKPEPAWETLLDVDALGRAEKESWVFQGASCLGPDYKHCLLSLSRGGSDAAVVREFDVATKRFVDGGFFVPEAKSDVAWADANTIYVASDFGAGSLTDSGYPRVVKRWSRGTPLAEAKTIYEAEKSDVSVFVSVDRTPGFERTIVGRSIDFYTNRSFLLKKGGQLAEIEKPLDASVSFDREWLMLELRSDLVAGKTTYRQGSLLAARAEAYLRGERHFELLFAPTATRSLAGSTHTRSHLLLNILDNVVSRVEELHWDGKVWQRRSVATPSPGALGISSLYDPEVERAGQVDPLGDKYLLSYTDFLTPDSLLLGSAGSDERVRLKQRVNFFDAEGMRTEQRFATSKDGTRVPYFIVWPKGAKADGRNPTLLYGYGGFEISLTPGYSGGYGRAWHQRGGVRVIANIRGGGEFGPAWHQAAVKAQKQHSYDDFIAVAEDLIASKVTNPRQLGIMGGSNGGLLVGATFVQRPDLFNAVVCQVPLLDMRRYSHLLAGASWMAEYGDPDKSEEWAWISKYSPYQNVRAGVHYPTVLFTTSTRDDRVHPAHARKMAARMLAQGHPLLYYENIEGGHGGAADSEQRATMQALEFSFLWRQLEGDGAATAPGG